MKRYSSMLALFLVFSFLAGCKCPGKKTAVQEEERTPAVTLVTPKETPKETLVTPKETPKETLVTPKEMPTIVEPAEKGKATPQQIAKAIKNEPIPIEKIPEGAVLKTPAEESPEAARIFKNVNFDFDRYNIRPDAREILKIIGKYLLENPKIEVMIEGHCDERGTREYNLVLGEQRALRVRRFLVGLGVAPGRLHTVSYGEDMPLDPASNEEAWAKNRRAEFKISEQ